MTHVYLNFVPATFLELNGYRIECDPEESDQFIRDVVSTKQNRFGRIVDWLTSHVTPIPL